MIMFIPGWELVLAGFIILFLFLWVVRLLRRVRRMQKIIWRLEAIDEREGAYSETGDAEGHG